MPQDTIWLPDISSIEEFIYALSGKNKYAQTRLMIELYLSCKEVNDNLGSLNDFFNWGQTLLQDFNEIDKHLIEPTKILENIKDISEIKRWDVSTEISESKVINRYYEFMGYMKRYYQNFNNRLEEQNVSYQGKSYRFIAENIENITKEIKTNTPDVKYIFIGFNTLNKSELTIVEHLSNEGIADIYWHTHPYYLENENQEAGYSFRKMQNQNLNNIFKYKNGSFKWIFNHNKNIKIEIISAGNNIAQCKIAGDILHHLNLKDYSNTCIVLCDETLLTPMLYSVPEHIQDINVTMGLPLKNIPLSSFFEYWFELLISYYKQGKFYYKNLENLYKHPLSQKLWNTREWQYVLTRYRKVYLHSKELPFELHNIIQQHKDCLQLFQHLINLLKSKTYYNKNQYKVNIEYLFYFHRLFNRIEQITLLYPQLFSINKPLEYIRIIKQIYQNELCTENMTIEGEPLKGLQIMGLLETRTLDFENVIMLSVNEGILPVAKAHNSFIPHDIKLHSGMFTYKQTDAIYAYHFYRMILESKKVYLIYNNDIDISSTGEESRFIMQLKQESRFEITQKNYIAYSQNKALRADKVEKTDEIIEKIKYLFQKGISPSCINTYLQCPIEFYHKYIIGIKEIDEIEEDIKSNTFGSIIHNVLKDLYQEPLKIGQLTRTYLENIDKNTILHLIEKAFDIYKITHTENGINYLSKEIGIKIVEEFLSVELENLTPNTHIKALEVELKKNIKLSDNTIVNLKGKADRIDISDGITRIIDYKTGDSPPKN